MQNTRNNSISKTILAIVTIFFMTAILAEPSLLSGYRTTAQVHDGGNIQSTSDNPPFKILGVSPLTKPPVSAIRLDPPKLSIAADPGANIDENTVQVAAPGKWLATTNTSWLEIHCATGNCGGSFLIVKFRIDGLKPGNYNGEVKITAGNDSIILPVSLTTMKVTPTSTDNGNTIRASIGRPTDTHGTPNYPTNSNPKIVAFGDSITYGYPLTASQAYPNLLQKKIAADGFNFEVVNSGVNGETSAGGVQRIDSVLGAMRNIKVVVLELGINDQSSISASATKQNLSQIINKIKAKNIQVVLSETVTASSSNEYKAVFEQLKTEHNLPLVPNVLEGTSTSDRLHPTASGAVFMTEKIYTVLKPTLSVVGGTPTPTPTPIVTGFMTQNPNNPHRWMLDGKPFYPVGIGDCIGEGGASVLTNWGFDGRTRPPAPGDGDRTDIDTYLKAYRDAGFNLFRWSVGNCSFKLDSERNWSEGDKLVSKLKQYGFRIQLVFFHTNSERGANGLTYVKKVIDRYGRQVDIWEVSNESNDADSSLIAIANYIKERDPNRHPVTTSFVYSNPPQVRDISAIDITSPHFYTFAGEFDVDKEMHDNIINWKRFGKPVIIGEYGNARINWDETSDLRNRLSTWSAFFAEGSIIFWNSSFIKNYSNPNSVANSYLGATTRGYIKVLTDFTREVPADARITKIEVNKPNLVRAYGLNSSSAYFAYLHAFTNHQSQTSGISITIEPQVAGTATWIEPATGRVLATGKVSAGRQTLTVPPFLIDVALKVSSSPSAKK